MRVAFLLAPALLICGCSQRTANPTAEPAPPPLPVQWNAKALQVPENANLAEEFAKAYPDAVAVVLGKENALVKDCPTNLDLLKKGFEPKAAIDFQAIQAMAVRCLALKALTGARTSAKSFLTGTVLDAERMPAALALAVSLEQERRRTEAQAKGSTWIEFAPKAKSRMEATDTALISTDGFEQRIQIVAQGDFNGDGIEDWLLQDEAWATSGTYRSVRLLLVTRTEAGGPIQFVRELQP